MGRVRGRRRNSGISTHTPQRSWPNDDEPPENPPPFFCLISFLPYLVGRLGRARRHEVVPPDRPDRLPDLRLRHALQQRVELSWGVGT